MEATLLPVFGASLPDDWRPAVTFRRLLVLFRHADPDSPMHTALRGRPAWTVEHELLDMVRRWTQFSVTRTEAPPSPLSPHAARSVDDARIAALADAKRRSEERQKEAQ